MTLSGLTSVAQALPGRLLLLPVWCVLVAPAVSARERKMYIYPRADYKGGFEMSAAAGPGATLSPRGRGLCGRSDVPITGEQSILKSNALTGG